MISVSCFCKTILAPGHWQRPGNCITMCPYGTIYDIACGRVSAAAGCCMSVSIVKTLKKFFTPMPCRIGMG